MARMRGAAAWIALTVVLALTDAARADAIVGGTEITSTRHYPAQVALLASRVLPQVPACGGVLIAPSWVLTAAHCVQAGTLTTVLAGSVTTRVLTEQTQFASIARTILHPLFQRASLAYDVALVELATAFVLVPQVVELATLAESDPPAGATAIVTGFGRLDRAASVSTWALHAVDLLVQSRSACTSNYAAASGPQRLGDWHVCVGEACVADRDSCSGDSGGPLWTFAAPGSPGDPSLVVFAVTSFGGSSEMPCGHPVLWSVNTRVPAVTAFVREAVGPTAAKNLRWAAPAGTGTGARDALAARAGPHGGMGGHSGSGDVRARLTARGSGDQGGFGQTGNGRARFNSAVGGTTFGGGVEACALDIGGDGAGVVARNTTLVGGVWTAPTILQSLCSLELPVDARSSVTVAAHATLALGASLTVRKTFAVGHSAELVFGSAGSVWAARLFVTATAVVRVPSETRVPPIEVDGDVLIDGSFVAAIPTGALSSPVLVRYTGAAVVSAGARGQLVHLNESVALDGHLACAERECRVAKGPAPPVSADARASSSASKSNDAQEHALTAVLAGVALCGCALTGWLVRARLARKSASEHASDSASELGLELEGDGVSGGGAAHGGGGAAHGGVGAAHGGGGAAHGGVGAAHGGVGAAHGGVGAAHGGVGAAHGGGGAAHGGEGVADTRESSALWSSETSGGAYDSCFVDRLSECAAPSELAFDADEPSLVTGEPSGEPRVLADSM